MFVKNSTLLDREGRSLHSVTLQARDSENKSGSTELEITVTDINDQYPIISRDSYQVFVKEGANFSLKIEVGEANEMWLNEMSVWGEKRQMKQLCTF